MRDTNFTLVGERFGKLTVIAFDRYENHKSYWLCRCDCGGEKVASVNALRAGHCKSCGCLRGRHLHSMPERVYGPLTPEKEQWLLRHFKHTKNDEIKRKLGISDGSLHRFARAHGLKKSTQFHNKCMKATTDAAKASHLANGTYPQKGFVIPNAHRFQPGHKEKASVKARRLAKAKVTRTKTIKTERARIHFGLPQRTKLRLNRQDPRVVSQRYNLRKHGYIIERGGMTAYYDENTKRMPLVEARKFGDRNYVAFKFLPLEGGGGAPNLSATML